MDLRLFASVYAIIFVAELPDKTALASVVLATRHRPLPVALGAALALAIQSVVAVSAGQLLSLLPARPVRVIAGLLFLGSAILMWIRHDEVEEKEGAPGGGFARTLGKAFLIVFLAEWGDLTQVGTAALAARYRAPMTVFAGATLALWSVVILAVVAGSSAGRVLSQGVTKRVATLLFAIVGTVLLAGWF